MRIEHFKYLFKRINGFYIADKIIMFRKPLELWYEETNETVSFKNLDEALEYCVAGKTIKEIILKADKLTLPELTGGRGAGSGSQGEYSFGHASGSAGDNSQSLFPAYANVRIKNKTLEGAMQEFQKKHANEKREWAYEVDDMGYVHQYVRGGASSVGIYAKGRNTMILHNHPSGGAFSDSDLISVSMQRNAKGIVASGAKHDYIFKKGGHFKANAFIKAVKTAKMKGSSYDDAVDKWLKANQKKYGYTYERKKN